MTEDTVIDQLLTARDLVRWGASRMNEAGVFFGHGTTDAVDESLVLVLHALSLPLDTPPVYLETRLERTERELAVQLIRRRIEERTPAAYLTHEAWFAGHPYYVDQRVLVPRSPIAELVERRFVPWLESADRVSRVLDLCAGSGCIGIACAHVFVHAQVDLGELSADALEVAELNLLGHGVEDRVVAIQSDLFEAFTDERYDLIVSNPPYVSYDEMALLPQEYLNEPTLGLVAGDTGLDLVARILRCAAEHLTGDGVLVVEVGATWPAVVACWPTVPFIWLRFQRGGEGVFVLTRDQLQRYTEAFSSLPV